MEQLDHVRSSIQKHIDFFRNKRNYNRRMAQAFVLSAAGLSAVSTVAIGVSEALDIGWIVLVALVASGLATVVGAWEALLAHKRLWAINNATLAELEGLKREIDYRSASPEPVDQAEVDDFFARFNKAIEEADDVWVKTYAAKTEGS